MENRKKRLRERVGIKALLAVLATACLFILFMCAVLTMICFKNNVYFEDKPVTFRQNVTANIAYRGLNDFILSFDSALSNDITITKTEAGYEYDRETLNNQWLVHMLPDRTNLAFAICDTDGNLIYGTSDTFKKNGEISGYTKVCELYDWNIEVIPDEGKNFEQLMNYSMSPSEAENYYANISKRGFYGDIYAVIPYAILDETGSFEITPSAVLLATVKNNGSIVEYGDQISAYNTVYSAYENDHIVCFDKDLNLVYDYSLAEYQNQYYDNDVHAPEPSNDLPQMQRETAVTTVIDASDTSITVKGEYYPYIIFRGNTYKPEKLSVNYYAYINDDPQIADSVYIGTVTTDIISKYSKTYPIIGIISFIVFLTAIIALLSFSGYRYPADGPSPCWFDKIPFEFFAAGLVFGTVILVEAYSELVYYTNILTFYSVRVLELAVLLLVPIAVPAFAVLSAMTLATRLKTGTFMRYLIIGFILRVFVKLSKIVWYALTSFRLTYKVFVIAALSIFLKLFIMSSGYGDMEAAIICTVLIDTVIAIWVLIWAAGFANIRKYVKKVANGELDAKINRNFLFGDLRKTADDLEGVGEGVKKAVEERTRSERLKTELITNVSHDLKTPLTSIVNYVDILSKDNIESVEAKEHIEVLKRQAARMKKLIEDLVDVSKASSGNVTANLERTDVNLLLTQTVEEYSQRLSSAGLEPIIRIPEKKMIASLDGKLMWRVFDNLLGNICKYAMTGTRVYITEEDLGENIGISFKNISSVRLEVDAEDLTERFVRGDASRSTEGSGLGLSIAKSLCDLQDVGFMLTVDGDLFKAELVIKKTGDEELLEDRPDFYGSDPNYSAEPESSEDETIGEGEENTCENTDVQS